MLLPCLACAPATVVADFGETDLLGVAGLKVPLHAGSRARFQHTELWLAAPSPAVQRALHAYDSPDDGLGLARDLSDLARHRRTVTRAAPARAVMAAPVSSMDGADIGCERATDPASRSE